MLAIPILFLIIPLALATFLLAIGTKGLLRRHPVAFSARWMFLFLVGAYLPGILYPLVALLDPHMTRTSTSEFLLVIQPILMLFGLVVFWFQMRGWYVVGISDASFRDALHRSLTQLGLTFEESIGRVRIPEQGIDLQVAVQSWMGQVQFKSKQRDGEKLVKLLSRELQTVFESHSVTSEPAAFAPQIIAGVLMLVIAVSVAIALPGWMG